MLADTIKNTLYPITKALSTTDIGIYDTDALSTILYNILVNSGKIEEQPTQKQNSNTIRRLNIKGDETCD